MAIVNRQRDWIKHEIMKTIILVMTTVFLVGLTAFMKDFSVNAKNRNHHADQKTIVKFESYNENFGIGKSKDVSEDLRYEVRGMYSRAIEKEKLSEAKVISDIISDYPINWITDYISIEILGTCNGEFMTAIGPNAVLTDEQKNILSKADMASDVVINVKYTYKVPIDNIIEKNTMHVLMTVVPDKQAEYIGGYDQLINYLKEKSIYQFSETDPKKFRQVVVRFTVNEEGKTIDVKIPNASVTSKAEQLLIDVINNMPQWKPAENAQGTKVKQEFELIVGNNVGGC